METLTNFIIKLADYINFFYVIVITIIGSLFIFLVDVIKKFSILEKEYENAKKEFKEKELNLIKQIETLKEEIRIERNFGIMFSDPSKLIVFIENELIGRKINDIINKEVKPYLIMESNSNIISDEKLMEWTKIVAMDILGNLSENYKSALKKIFKNEEAIQKFIVESAHRTLLNISIEINKKFLLNKKKDSILANILNIKTEEETNKKKEVLKKQEKNPNT
jgi:MFS superfamily sulfate permease-like transporter